MIVKTLQIITLVSTIKYRWVASASLVFATVAASNDFLFIDTFINFLFWLSVIWLLLKIIGKPFDFMARKLTGRSFTGDYERKLMEKEIERVGEDAALAAAELVSTQNDISDDLRKWEIIQNNRIDECKEILEWWSKEKVVRAKLAQKKHETEIDAKYAAYSVRKPNES
jgi:signal transduction histidine kinase